MLTYYPALLTYYSKVVLPELQRTATLDCLQGLKDKQGFARKTKTRDNIKADSVKELKLFEEVHNLLKVLWSGRFAVHSTPVPPPVLLPLLLLCSRGCRLRHPTAWFPLCGSQTQPSGAHPYTQHFSLLLFVSL